MRTTLTLCFIQLLSWSVRSTSLTVNDEAEIASDELAPPKRLIRSVKVAGSSREQDVSGAEVHSTGHAKKVYSLSESSTAEESHAGSHVTSHNSAELEHDQDYEDHIHEEVADLFEDDQRNLQETIEEIPELQSATLMENQLQRKSPIHCLWNSYGGWSACWNGKTCGPGTQWRSRGFKQSAKFGGNPCTGSTSQRRSCIVGAHCPIDCKWTSWSGWWPRGCPGCGGGRLTRNRVAHGPYHGGGACSDRHITTAYISCDYTPPCPINCQMTSWTTWTKCSVTCGMGMQQRSRDKVHEGYYGGSVCAGTFMETKDCVGVPCPIDCAVDQWSEWSKCNKECGLGSSGRYRAKLVPDQFSGAKCPHLTEVLGCNPDACKTAEAKVECSGVGCYIR